MKHQPAEQSSSTAASVTRELENTSFARDGMAFEPPVYDANTLPIIQTKLTIGQPNDRYEREADAMADQVMRITGSGNAPDVQAKCRKCEKEDQHVQRKEANGPPITSISAGNMDSGQNTSPSFAGQLRASKGIGQLLPTSVKSDMENAFGRDFSGVRVHTDHASAEMNQEINARAFTHGEDIYFNKGEFNPTSSEGKRILGHELTHVVQQTGNRNDRIQRQPNPNQGNAQDVELVIGQVIMEESTPHTGDLLNLQWTIKNLGAVPSDPFETTITVYLEEGTRYGCPEEKGKPIETYYVPENPVPPTPQQNNYVTSDFDVGPFYVEGSYRFVVEINTDHGESREITHDNNKQHSCLGITE